MGELLTEVLALRKENAEIKQMVNQLFILIKKNKIDDTWLSEEEAAESLGLSPISLRRKVKKPVGQWHHITFRNNNGRNWQYSRKGILKYKQLTSTEMA